MSRQSGQGVFVISVVAGLTDTHPQTLRAWERAGLLAPARSQGGVRLYSEADVAILRRVLELSTLGYSPAAIRHVMRLERENTQLREALTRQEVSNDS